MFYEGLSGRRLLFPGFAAAVATAAVVSACGSGASAESSKSAGDGPVASAAAASTSLTAKATKAANAFEASLSDSQKSAVQFAFDSSKKESGWSNLPTSLVARNGIKIADLSSAQQAKLQALLKIVTSTQGYAQEEGTRAADTYLNEQQSSGAGATTPGGGATGTTPGGGAPTGSTPGGGAPTGSTPGGGAPTGSSPTSSGGNGTSLSYGQGLYYVAFYGTPSTSHKWTVQFGGHHLAIHMTFSGSAVSDTPYFTGVEPKAEFSIDGKTYQPMKRKAGELYSLAQSLTTAQQTKAKISGSYDDVVVGPGQDGKFPTKQGVTVTSLSKKQQSMVTKAITNYVADEPTAEAKKRIALYVSQYSKTKLAIAGTPDGTTQGGYVRLHGPRLWLEIATQPGVVLSATHYHSILRDIKSDYGAGT